ncbi:MAG: DNA polymerase I, partial [Synergistaceae bacterium]|nr:DNA polymerase I [Synergistaceae bacterium]
MILLVDGHGLAFRGFYALPQMNAPDGTPTNAVLGFFNMLLKAADEWRPEGIGLFFDPKGPTARDKMYGQYKEGRRPTPDDFKAQMPFILDLAGALGYPVFIREGTEADDVIASTALSLEDAGFEPVILSADKDLMQVLKGKIKMARPAKGVSEFKLYDENIFREEYGFEPGAMADYLALAGDSADNIPGVPGVGDKTARSLLARYGSLDAIYADRGLSPESVRLKLERGKKSAYMSHSLAVPQRVEPVERGQLAMGGVDRERSFGLLERLGLRRLISRIGLDAPETGGQNAGTQTAVSASETGHDTAESASWDGIFSEDALILTREPDCISTRSGLWKKFSSEDSARLEAWLASPGHVMILADYGDYCERFPALGRYSDSIRDVVLAGYFFHPDASSHPHPEDPRGVMSAWDELARGDLSEDMLSVQRTIDAPPTPVLTALKRHGLYVDEGALRILDAELASRTSAIESEIYSVFGGTINLNSPKQVGEFLFERLRLPVLKKTKTGYSTDAAVLEELSRLPEPFCDIPKKMLEYRECAKMSSGFVQPFIKHAAASK